MIVYGSGISEGNSHSHSNLPTVLFGHGNGKINTGQHVQYTEGTKMNRLFLTLMESMGLMPHCKVTQTDFQKLSRRNAVNSDSCVYRRPSQKSLVCRGVCAGNDHRVPDSVRS